MTERDYAIRSFKEITLNAARHTEERMDLYYEKMKALMNNYQDLILENQMVLPTERTRLRNTKAQ